MDNQEIYYIVTSKITVVIITFITSFCFSSLIKPFVLKKGVAWKVGVTYFCIILALHEMPWYMEKIAAYGISILAAFLVMSILDKRNIYQKIFLSVTFFSLRWLLLGIGNCIAKVVFYESMKLPGYFGNWWLQYIAFVLESLVDVVTSFLLLYLSVWVIKRVYTYKQEIVNRKEALLLCMPCILGILAYEVLQFYSKLYAEGTGESLFGIYGGYDLLCVCYYGVSFLTILTVVLLFQNLKARQMEQQQGILLQEQINDMERHISEVERLYQDIRSLKHDMGNHIMTLEGLYVKGEKEEAKKYVEKLQGQLLGTGLKIKSGNPVTDVILTEKYREAEKYGIDFQCKFYYPEETAINAFDVSIILNNAIMNGIEAAKQCEEPEINIISWRRKNVYMIKIENNYKNKIILGENNLPVSTKKEGCHGFGLANIRKIAQKYYGDIDISCENSRFILNIMLMCV